MGTPPRIGRFSTEHQPPRTPSQPASFVTGSLEEREQAKIKADISAREQALDDAALDYRPTHLDLSPDEIAKQEAERAQIAADLKANRPGKPGPERSAPESLSSRPISDIGRTTTERIEPVPDPAKLDALETAEQELLALEQDESASLDAELRAAEEKTAREMARLRAAGDLKRAEIRKRKEDLQAQIAKERAAALPAEIKQKAQTITREAEANRTRSQSGLDVQREAFAKDWVTPLQTARETVAAIAKLDQVFGPSLREMADIAAFTDTNSAWPTELRVKLRDQCILPARKLVEFLNSYQRTEGDSPRGTIAQVERMLRSWTPGTHVAALREMLGYVNTDAVRYVRNQISEINARFEMIEAQGHEYIRSGNVPHEIDVMNPSTERIRREAKAQLLYRGARDPRQTHATGMGEIMPGESR